MREQPRAFVAQVALAAATAELEARLTGHKISGAGVFAAARYLEAAFDRAGYVLVRVIQPPQQLANGARLKLVAVDGFTECIETSYVSDRVRDRIMHLVGLLTGRRGLMLAEIERRVLFAGDTPGVLLRATLSPGRATAPRWCRAARPSGTCCARIEKRGVQSGSIKQSHHPTQTHHSHHPDSALL